MSKTIWTKTDAAVLEELEKDTGNAMSFRRMAMRCGTSMAGLRKSIRKLALREPGDDPRHHESAVGEVAAAICRACDMYGAPEEDMQLLLEACGRDTSLMLDVADFAMANGDTWSTAEDAAEQVAEFRAAMGVEP